MSHWVKAVLVGDDGDMAAMCIWVLFNSPFSVTSRVSQCQKGKTIWILLKQETVSGSGITWVYASLHLAPDRWPCQHPTTQVFYGQMPFLLPNQQHQSTKDRNTYTTKLVTFTEETTEKQNFLKVSICQKLATCIPMSFFAVLSHGML